MNRNIYIFLHSLIFVAILVGGIGWLIVGEEKPFKLIFGLSIATDVVVRILERTKVIVIEPPIFEHQPITVTSIMYLFALLAFIVSSFFLLVIGFFEVYENIPGRTSIIFILVIFCVFSAFYSIKLRNKYFEE